MGAYHEEEVDEGEHEVDEVGHHRGPGQVGHHAQLRLAGTHLEGAPPPLPPLELGSVPSGRQPHGDLGPPLAAFSSFRRATAERPVLDFEAVVCFFEATILQVVFFIIVILQQFVELMKIAPPR